MIREKILKYLTNKNIQHRPDSAMPPYHMAKKIGIFFNSGTVDYEEIKQLKNTLELDEKEISVLGYASKMNGPAIYDVVAKREIGLTGKIKSPEFEKFSRDRYDYIIILDRNSDYVMSYLASACNAHCKVGIFQDDEPGVIDFQIKSGEGSECDELVKYLKMIK